MNNLMNNLMYNLMFLMGGEGVDKMSMLINEGYLIYYKIKRNNYKYILEGGEEER